MVVQQPRLGLDHLTVVPPNFDPSTAGESADDASAGSGSGRDG